MPHAAWGGEGGRMAAIGAGAHGTWRLGAWQQKRPPG